MRPLAIAFAAMLAVLSACSGSSSGTQPPAAVCGNGAVETGEGCDDGNTAAADGCSGACTVEAGWTCTGSRSVCTPAGCGDGVRSDPEECDDGNTANLDGCDASCKFEQVLRANQLAVAFAPTSTCAQNAFGGAVTNAFAQQQLNTSMAQAVGTGQLTFLLWFRGLDDLAGANDAAFEVGVFGGSVHPQYEASFVNTAQRDGWFQVEGRSVDGAQVPHDVLPGSFSGGTLSAGPGRALLPFEAGAPVLLDVFDARISLQAAGLSAPAVSLTGLPPGHLASEHLAGALRSFQAAAGGELCGAIVSRGLSQTPLASQFVTACGYPAGGSFLDLLVGGCSYLGAQLSAPTQPDRVDPAAPVLGAGGPYRLVFDSGVKAVTGCQDAIGAMVDLGGCLDAAGYSSAFTFAADRVIVKPACGDGSIGAGETCDDGNVADADGCSSACAVEAGFTCSGAPSVCATPCGNGAIDAGEACDDGNVSSGDGCSSACAVEDGFSCTGEPSACTSVCGDGIVARGEACDDGNVRAGDGCDATCAIESGWSCAGSPSVCEGFCASASCDDGVACTTDACDGTLQACVHVLTDAACEDGLPCTIDVCSPASSGADPVTGCTRTAAPNGTACDAGGGVTGTCQSGACAAP